MVKGFVFIIILICSIPLYGKNEYGTLREFEIDSVCIILNDFDENKIHDPCLTCVSFDKLELRDGYVLRNNLDRCAIDSICKELEGLEHRAERFIDVKCKMYFYSADSCVFTVCADERTTMFDGGSFKTSQSLWMALRQIKGKRKLENIGIRSEMQYKSDMMVEGKNAMLRFLILKMPLLQKFMINQDSYAFNIVFKAGKDGKTLFAHVQRSRKLFNKTPENILKEIEAFCCNNVTWNKNKERTSFDLIIIKCVFFPKDQNVILYKLD